ncbi:hypothetical protein [Iodobacter fluviatilis]|nr:hypothetical protein [Iodobacter fluviatilis]
MRQANHRHSGCPCQPLTCGLLNRDHRAIAADCGSVIRDCGADDSIIYLAFFKLLILPFSPGYAAFTFPLVIGATALFKVSHLLGQWEFAAAYVNQIQWLAQFELGIATVVVGYVALRYAIFFMAKDDVVTFKAGQLLHR